MLLFRCIPLRQLQCSWLWQLKCFVIVDDVIERAQSTWLCGCFHLSTRNFSQEVLLFSVDVAFFIQVENEIRVRVEYLLLFDEADFEILNEVVVFHQLAVLEALAKVAIVFADEVCLIPFDRILFGRLVHALLREVVLDDVAGQQLAAAHCLKLVGSTLIREVVEAYWPRGIAIEGTHHIRFAPLKWLR